MKIQILNLIAIKNAVWKQMKIKRLEMHMRLMNLMIKVLKIKFSKKLVLVKLFIKIKNFKIMIYKTKRHKWIDSNIPMKLWKALMHLKTNSIYCLKKHPKKEFFATKI